MSLSISEDVVAQQSTDRLVTDLEFVGLKRTSEPWLRSFLSLSLPKTMSLDDSNALEEKILTTDVFSRVSLHFQERPTGFLLVIEVEEKWTTIPVLRGAFGGGTPLRVLGAYDIHTLGQLLILGGEFRKYGDAHPGWVIYGRDPKNSAGKYFLGAEVWREFREREIYHQSEKVANLKTDANKYRLNFLAPLNERGTNIINYPLRFGLDLSHTETRASKYSLAEFRDNKPKEPFTLDYDIKPKSQTRLFASLVYDDIINANLLKDGLRLIANAGPVLEGNNTYSGFEIESFYYLLLPHSLNLAAHVFLGRMPTASLNSQYFLGGFDSVRGLPDGFLSGRSAFYGNLEMRTISKKFQYLWLQNVLFNDFGTTADDFSALAKQKDFKASLGTGLRISIPQIHRMVFRLDYAWSIDGSGSQGISAGMNQFFQPYRPL
jgi:outer membrane protein assembly factor BamA